MHGSVWVDKTDQGLFGWTKVVRQMNGQVIYIQRFYVCVCVCALILREQTARDQNPLSHITIVISGTHI